MPRRKRPAALACILSLCACVAGSHESSMDSGGTPEPGKRPVILDLEHRELVRPIGPDMAEPSRQKFVRIEIIQVHNPRQLRLAFEVRFRADGRKEVLLGTFALFPADNPGDFIVATRGELRKEGTVILSMQVLDELKPGDEVRLSLKPLSFLEDGLPRRPPSN
jgi:hypothetical protein